MAASLSGSRRAADSSLRQRCTPRLSLRTSRSRPRFLYRQPCTILLAPYSLAQRLGGNRSVGLFKGATQNLGAFFALFDPYLLAFPRRPPFGSSANRGPGSLIGAPAPSRSWVVYRIPAGGIRAYGKVRPGRVVGAKEARHGKRHDEKDEDDKAKEAKKAKKTKKNEYPY
jgi:hypothetical protein